MRKLIIGLVFAISLVSGSAITAPHEKTMSEEIQDAQSMVQDGQDANQVVIDKALRMCFNLNSLACDLALTDLRHSASVQVDAGLDYLVANKLWVEILYLHTYSYGTRQYAEAQRSFENSAAALNMAMRHSNEAVLFLTKIENILSTKEVKTTKKKNDN